jgi:hypothetical protein
MPSRWCAWCGMQVTVGVVVAGVVVYHEFCWWRRTRVLAEPPRSIRPFLKA